MKPSTAVGIRYLLFTEGYRQTPVDDLLRAAAFADFATLPGLVAGLAQSPQGLRFAAALA